MRAKGDRVGGLWCDYCHAEVADVVAVFHKEIGEIELRKEWYSGEPHECKKE